MLSHLSPGTNTYLVGQGSRRLLIDTGEGRPSWRAALQSVLASEKATITTAILTHWHPDHIGGVGDLNALSPGVRVYKNQPTEGLLSLHDGQQFDSEVIDGATLRTFHCPGHTKDHMALILEEEVGFTFHSGFNHT